MTLHRLGKLIYSLPCCPFACLNSPTSQQVAAGSVQKAVIVETKKEFQRADGSCVRFDRNACVLVNAKGLPIGTRVLGFVTHELRARQLMKVLQGPPNLNLLIEFPSLLPLQPFPNFQPIFKFPALSSSGSTQLRLAGLCNTCNLRDCHVIQTSAT